VDRIQGLESVGGSAGENANTFSVAIIDGDEDALALWPR
jgi:hypothetical protein